MAKRKYRTPALESLHSAMEALYKVGAISQEAMCGYDRECLDPYFTQEEIDANRQIMREMIDAAAQARAERNAARDRLLG